MTISAFLLRGSVLFAGLLLVAGCGGSGPEPEVDPTPEEPVAEAPPEEEPTPVVRDETPKYVDPNVEYASILRPIHFDFDKYNIRSDARPTLEGIAGLLKNNRDWKILIEGHCDERGTAEYNLALGEQRALATKRYLASLGVSESRFQTISYGKERPVALGRNEEAWAKNRRAEFRVEAPGS
jgi:peptidoglycan-associated lipoprotein